MLLPLDDLLAVIHEFIEPGMSRSALMRLLKRRGLSRLPAPKVDPKETTQTIMQKGGVGYGPRWQAMAEALHLNLSELAKRVESHPHMRFIYLARQVNPEQAEWIDKLHLPGINLRDESRRFYPAGHVAANLLGFTNIDNQGIEGIEKSFNAQLTGKPGRRLVRKDRHGHVIENITEMPAVPAHNIQLSIDERLQTVTEDALDNAVNWNKAESGAAVLIKIDTGEILAMAQLSGLQSQ